MAMFPRYFLLMALLNTAWPLSLPAAEHAHGVCINCHVSGERQEAKSNPGEPAVKKPCIACHREALLPSGGPPSRGAAIASGHMIESGVQEEKIAPLGGRSFVRMDCLSCHVPHQQGRPKFLRSAGKAAEAMGIGTALDPATQVCLSCHPVAAEFKGIGRRYVRHPVGVPVALGKIVDRSKLPPLVDVKGTDDPSDDVIGCTTCHYPHASKNAFLLRWNLAELSPACLKCHPEVSPPAPGAAKGLVAWR